MKHKLPFVLSIGCFLVYKLVDFFTGDSFIALLVFTLPIIMLTTNMIFRRKLLSKVWFLSKYNFLLEKETTAFTSDISKELLYEKLIEVVQLSKFKLMDFDANAFELLVTTAPNFWTWGENLYIEIKEREDGVSIIKVTAVTVFGSYSWNRNSKNHSHFYESFEQSLTI